MDGRRKRLHNGRISRKQCRGKDDLGWVWKARKQGAIVRMWWHRTNRGLLVLAATIKEPTK